MSEKTRPCEICGRLIDPERVEAVPETRLCIEHAQAMAAYGGEFLTSARPTSLGKAGSLKKNYGDVTVTHHRNIEGLRRLRDDYRRAQEGDTAE